MKGRAFHKEGPMMAKDRVWAIVVLARGTNKSDRSRDRRGRWEDAERGGRMTSLRYFGASPSLDLRTKARTLNWMRSERGSQCSWLTMKDDIWEYLGRWAINRAAALRTDWIGDRRNLTLAHGHDKVYMLDLMYWLPILTVDSIPSF